ncbi:MAG: 4-hydroxy-tetrahydrodipicolinate reductase [Verrucomicrobia bacterium]|nr:MAG: 4-hydroxy-tetrahydrodipicolinate reductase [Verrucomicrobiota bacterium]
MTSPIRLLITGIEGRMGQAIATCTREDSRFQINGAIGTQNSDSFSDTLKKCDVTIDFTEPAATLSFVEISAQENKPIVIGTTGHSEATRAAITQCSQKIPIVLAPNFSVGINTLFWLSRKTAEILGPEFDLEIVEMHHRHKKDAPSGTACRLAEILAEVRSLSVAHQVRHGRQGIIGERPVAEIGMHALRGGDVVGDHTVLFSGDGERVELSHKASNRTTFARGSLRAAAWILKQPPGLYDMQDVLSLR